MSINNLEALDIAANEMKKITKEEGIIDVIDLKEGKWIVEARGKKHIWIIEIDENTGEILNIDKDKAL